MQKYLPSKKFIYTVISVVFAILIIWVVKTLGERTIDQIIQADTPKVTVEQFKLIDTDGDTIPDWEETLWKTDAKRADSDGDGTNDGDEIKINRDPTEANTAPEGKTPSDKIDQRIIDENIKVEEDFNKLTETEKFGRYLFSEYLATKKISSELSSGEKFSVVDNAISNLPTATFKVYTEADLSVSANIDSQSLRAYSNSLAEIIITNLKTKTELLDTIITDFADTETAKQANTALARLDPVILKNKTTVSSLLKLSVPKILVNEHLKILNAVEEIYEILLTIKNSGDDLIKVLPPLNHYDASVQNLANSLVTTRESLLKLKVTFASQNDFGYQLFNVIMLKK